METDIKSRHTLELKPYPLLKEESASIVPDLSDALNRASCLRAAIAYWTVEPDFVHNGLAKILSCKNGFLCVDLHFPTDIDQLELLAKVKANIYIHLGDLGISTETVERQMPKHLLHTKLLLFDFDDGRAEIWCGSHNWTKRGLTGPNIEASLVLDVRQDSPIYGQVSAMLEDIKGICDPFSIDLVDYYKWLREDNKPTKPLIELESEDGFQLENLEITIFGKDESDLDRVGKVGDEVYLLVLDIDMGEWVFYPTRIVGVSVLPGTVTEFEQQRFVYQKGMDFALLEMRSTPPQEELSETHYYYLTLHVHEQIMPSPEVFDPDVIRWKKTSDDPLIRRLDHHDFNRMIENRSPNIIKRPLPEKNLVAQPIPIDEDLTDLVKRRILRLETTDDSKNDNDREGPKKETLIQPKLFE